MNKFQPSCLPTLIGSLPIKDHQEAADLVLQYTPEIPLWVQLPFYSEEGMLAQFVPGMPGLKNEGGKIFVDSSSDTFDMEFLSFYETYMEVAEGQKDVGDTIFSMTPETAQGFFTLAERLSGARDGLAAVKGQITGPFTFATSLTDENGRAVFYNEQVRDAAVKLLALKARWQARELAKFGKPVMIFFDEPGLTGFGSSSFISVSKEEISQCFEEVFEAVHAEGGLCGVHVCANADWSLILESSADIVSFDAYGYFDTFVLYPNQIRAFMEAGKILAWGIVPTLSASDIEKEDLPSLLANWKEKAAKIEALGIDRETVRAQSLITPSCGTGSSTLENAMKVLRLTSELSATIREES